MRAFFKKLFARSVPETILIVFAAVAAIILILLVASFFVDRPLRGYLEKTMNTKLKGYHVSLPGAHFQIIGFSLTLKDLKIMQNEHPEPPIAYIPSLTASVQWRELLSGHVVADLEFDKPQMHVDLTQLRTEAKRTTKIKNEGWQQAFESIYPLDINHIIFNDGDIVYIDVDKKMPLHIKHLNMEADNIRNIHSTKNAYPSLLHAEAIIFGTGKGTIDGNADFLEEPYMGVKTKFKLKDVPLDRFKSITARENLNIRGGVISTEGEIEYAPHVETVHVSELTIDKVKIDYIHKPQTAEAEAARVQEVKAAAKKAGNKPEMLLKLDTMRLTHSELGYVNITKSPGYRVFISDVDLTVKNLSNHFTEGVSDITLSGLFMGNGLTTASAAFRPAKTGANFDLKLAIKNTDLLSMNKILLAYGNFDVVHGFFSLYTDIHVKDRQISGYIKPLFTNMQVYDKRKDADKSLFRKLYYMLIGGISHILENPRSSVATKVNISGKAANPKTSTLQTIIGLIKNAFFHMILPGFDRSIRGTGSNPPPQGYNLFGPAYYAGHGHARLDAHYA
jgi:hypothetical protein